MFNPDCDAECYDEELDPKGEKYNGCASKTRKGKTCLVIMFSKWTSLLPRLGRPVSRLTLISLPTIVATQTGGTGPGKWNRIRFWNCGLMMISYASFQVLCTARAHTHYKGRWKKLGCLSTELHQRYVIPNRLLGSQFITILPGGAGSLSGPQICIT